jgi:N-acetylmuramoyl-L-alanine amidase CwlA
LPNITQDFVPGLPKLSYDRGYGNYIGVIAHATANYGSTKEGDRAIFERDWMERSNEINPGSPFVHFFCDWDVILQTADLNYKAYGAGKPANGRYAHVELCQTKDQEKFKKSYKNYVWTLAYILAKKNLGVYDGRTLVSHKWVSDNLGGTDHTDPIGYLASHGVSWKDLVSDVQKSYFEQTAPVVPTITVDASVEFICKKIKSVDAAYWKRQAKAVQFLDIMVSKIATKWIGETTDKTPVIKLPPRINMTVDEALMFIDSKVALTHLSDWKVKARNVLWLDLFFIKIAYVWQKEGNK